jgi:hypothetical protein
MYLATIVGKKSRDITVDPISSQTEPVLEYRVHVEWRATAVTPSAHVVLYKLVKETNRRVNLDVICDVIGKKFRHCLQSKSNSKGLRGFVVRANIEWIKSVLETEFDYHLGKRQCTKKKNAAYLAEYKATQLSGFGERFYRPDWKISDSIISKLYPLEI